MTDVGVGPRKDRHLMHREDVASGDFSHFDLVAIGIVALEFEDVAGAEAILVQYSN